MAHVVARDVRHELVGEVTVVAPPVAFSETPLRVTSPSPVHGRHTGDILREAGLSDGEIARMVAGGAVLQG